jgi:hypothetical protein
MSPMPEPEPQHIGDEVLPPGAIRVKTADGGSIVMMREWYDVWNNDTDDWIEIIEEGPPVGTQEPNVLPADVVSSEANDPNSLIIS